MSLPKCDCIHYKNAYIYCSYFIFFEIGMNRLWMGMLVVTMLVLGGCTLTQQPPVTVPAPILIEQPVEKIPDAAIIDNKVDDKKE